MVMVVGGAFRVVTGMSCASSTGRAKLIKGVGSDFLWIRTKLTSTASSSGVLVATVAVENYLVRSCLALAATRLAFFRADFGGDSRFFLERAIFSIFIFNNRFSRKFLNKGQLFIKSI